MTFTTDVILYRESQSSTDTALSSEATTPTQNSTGDIKIKQEPPDPLENGQFVAKQFDLTNCCYTPGGGGGGGILESPCPSVRPSVDARAVR